MAELNEPQKLALQIAYLTLRHEYAKSDKNESVNLNFLYESFRQLSQILTELKTKNHED